MKLIELTELQNTVQILASFTAELSWMYNLRI